MRNLIPSVNDIITSFKYRRNPVANRRPIILSLLYKFTKRLMFLNGTCFSLVNLISSAITHFEPARIAEAGYQLNFLKRKLQLFFFSFAKAYGDAWPKNSLGELRRDTSGPISHLTVMLSYRKSTQMHLKKTNVLLQ